jgi:hypothetical protein
MNTWVLIMTLFVGPSNSKFQMEALTTYSSKERCVSELKRALAIPMPISREFWCLKVRRTNKKLKRS